MVSFNVQAFRNAGALILGKTNLHELALEGLSVSSLGGQTINPCSTLSEMIQHINRLVYDASAENRYATFFYAQYDAPSRRLTYVNAGHNPPLLFRAGSAPEIRRLEAGGLVVGLLEDFAYSQDSVALEEGDLLVAYTDGITETMTVADEEWGEENLIETVHKCGSQSARDVIARIMEAADRFAAGAKQHDDMTITVVRVVAG